MDTRTINSTPVVGKNLIVGAVVQRPVRLAQPCLFDAEGGGRVCRGDVQHAAQFAHARHDLFRLVDHGREVYPGGRGLARGELPRHSGRGQMGCKIKRCMFPHEVHGGAMRSRRAVSADYSHTSCSSTFSPTRRGRLAPTTRASLPKRGWQNLMREEENAMRPLKPLHPQEVCNRAAARVISPSCCSTPTRSCSSSCR